MHERTLNSVSQLKVRASSKFVKAAQFIDFILRKVPAKHRPRNPRTVIAIPPENRGFETPPRRLMWGACWNLYPMASGSGMLAEDKNESGQVSFVRPHVILSIVVIHLRPLTLIQLFHTPFHSEAKRRSPSFARLLRRHFCPFFLLPIFIIFCALTPLRILSSLSYSALNASGVKTSPYSRSRTAAQIEEAGGVCRLLSGPQTFSDLTRSLWRNRHSSCTVMRCPAAISHAVSH